MLPFPSIKLFILAIHRLSLIRSYLAWTLCPKLRRTIKTFCFVIIENSNLASSTFKRLLLDVFLALFLNNPQTDCRPNILHHSLCPLLHKKAPLRTRWQLYLYRSKHLLSWKVPSIRIWSPPYLGRTSSFRLLKSFPKRFIQWFYIIFLRKLNEQSILPKTKYCSLLRLFL